MKNLKITRRGALAGIGAATAALAAPAIAVPAGLAGPTERVYLNWTSCHEAASAPQIGDAVQLRTEFEPYMQTIAAYSNDGKLLGHLAPRKAKSILSALDRGDRVEVSVGRRLEGDMPDGQGWRVTTLDVAIRRNSLI